MSAPGFIRKEIQRRITARNAEIAAILRDAGLEPAELDAWLTEHGHRLFSADTGDGHVIACQCGEIPGNMERGEAHILDAIRAASPKGTA